VRATAAVGRTVAPADASFCQAYADVEKIAVSEELIDLAAEGFDAGIRLGRFIDAAMVTVRGATVSLRHRRYCSRD
jgi:DNA-binding transcriptional LysR family regulator